MANPVWQLEDQMKTHSHKQIWNCTWWLQFAKLLSIRITWVKSKDYNFTLGFVCSYLPVCKKKVVFFPQQLQHLAFQTNKLMWCTKFMVYVARYVLSDSSQKLPYRTLGSQYWHILLGISKSDCGFHRTRMTIVCSIFLMATFWLVRTKLATSSQVCCPTQSKRYR